LLVSFVVADGLLSSPREFTARREMLTSECRRLPGILSAKSQFERIRMCSVRLSVTHVQANGAAGKGRIEAPQ